MFQIPNLLKLVHTQAMDDAREQGCKLCTDESFSQEDELEVLETKERQARESLGELEAEFDALKCGDSDDGDKAVDHKFLTAAQALIGWAENDAKKFTGSHTSPTMRNFGMHEYMKDATCMYFQIGDSKSLMEMFLRSLPLPTASNDTAAFTNAHALLITGTWPPGPAHEPWVGFIEYVVTLAAKICASPSPKMDFTSHDAARIVERCKKFVGPLAARHADPRVTAAASAIVIYSSHNVPPRYNAALEAFVANTILLSEGMQPISTALISQAVWVTALSMDVAKSKKDNMLTATHTVNLLRTLRRKCDQCGNSATEDMQDVKRCGKCKLGHYCSVECQTAARPIHSVYCIDNAHRE